MTDSENAAAMDAAMLLREFCRKQTRECDGCEGCQFWQNANLSGIFVCTINEPEQWCWG